LHVCYLLLGDGSGEVLQTFGPLVLGVSQDTYRESGK
jgi:hypothetical protein